MPIYGNFLEQIQIEMARVAYSLLHAGYSLVDAVNAR